MNGKKAKTIRKIAGVGKEEKAGRKYFQEERTLRNQEVKNLLGEVVAKYSTATLKLVKGERLVYKTLKEAYSTLKLNR